MENYEFTHKAPNPQYNLRVPKGQEPSILGVPGSTMEQWISAHPTNPREDAMKDLHKKYNPEWDKMINKAPKEIRDALKKIRETGVGSDVSRRFMEDPRIQEALGANGVQESIALERMYSHGGSFGGVLNSNGSRMQAPTNPDSMVEQHNLRIAGTGQFQRALTQSLTNKNGTANPEYNGMKPADVMNLSSYASKYGGAMSTMNFNEKGEDTMVGTKVQHIKKMTQGVSEFMKIAGSKDLGEALEQIKAFEGKEFAKIDPDAFFRKMKNITMFAASANIGAKDMMAMMARGKGTLEAAAGRGVGTGFEGGEYWNAEKKGFQKASTAEEGMSGRVTEKTLAIARMRGITDTAEIAELDNLRQQRQGRMGNTTGGRAIELAVKLRAAGKISKETFERFKKASETGVGMKAAVAEITEKSGLRMDDVINNEGRYNAENYRLDKSIVASGGNLAGLGREIVDIDDKKFTKDSEKHMAQAKAGEQRKYVKEMQGSFGVKFSKDEQKAQAREAMKKMQLAVGGMDKLDPAQKELYLAKIEQGLAQGISMDTLEKRLGKMGGEGATIGAMGQTALQEIKHEGVLGSAAYKAGMNRDDMSELSAEMKAAGIKNGFGKGTRLEKLANAKASIEAKLKDKNLDPGTRKLLQYQLDKMTKRAKDPKDNELARKNMKDITDAGEADAKIGETEQVRDKLGAEGNAAATAEANAMLGSRPATEAGKKAWKDMTSEERDAAREKKKEELESGIKSYKGENRRGRPETETSKKTDEQAAAADKDRDKPTTAGKETAKLSGEIKIIGMDSGLLEINVPSREVA